MPQFSRRGDPGRSGTTPYRWPRVFLARQTWDPRRFDYSNPSQISPELRQLGWRIASQGSYAEEAGMLAANRLLEWMPEATVRRVLAQQVEDESRHTEAFERYARAVGGSVAPPLSSTNQLLSGLYGVSDVHELFLIHTLLEALAVDQFRIYVEVFKGDPLSAIYARVRRDEARHVANGLRIIENFASHVSSIEFCARLTQLNQRTLDIAGVTDSGIEGLANVSGRSLEAVRNLMIGRHEERCRQLQLLFHSQLEIRK